MKDLEILQLQISKPFEPLYPAAVVEWASKEARKDNESRPTAGLGSLIEIFRRIPTH
jgi:hypothetical protein